MTSRDHDTIFHILVLGGSSDASALLRALQAAPDLRLQRHFRITLSLAGRTRAPLAQAAGPVSVTTRIGGFGGPEGLARFLREQHVDCMVNATHPFAAQMAGNAIAAASNTGTPLLRLVRPAWEAVAGDDWRHVATMADAVAAIGAAPRRVFLTIGRQNLAAFMAAPQHHYLARTIEAADPDVRLPNVTWVQARGPFSFADERTLLTDHGVELLVTKNSGGADAAAKLMAARELGLPVIMIDRPPAPASQQAAFQQTSSVAEAVAWLQRMVRDVHDPAPAAEDSLF